MNTDHMVFVFGSNQSGIHGAGAARFALEQRGAILHRAVGRQGQAWAIPTKDRTIRHTLPLNLIQQYVTIFMDEAGMTPDEQYQVTQIGCGLAGLKAHEIAPMFRHAPKNCFFDTDWEPYLGNAFNYWGHI